MIVQPAPPEHLPWLAERAGITLHPALRALEALQGDRIVAMVGYDGWMPGACQVHLAVEHPAALRHLLRHGFELPFVRLGLVSLIGPVEARNGASIRLVRHLGFKLIHRGRGWLGRGRDLCLFEMRREDCRFLSDNWRKERRAA